ncbi:MAG TPA: septum formation initiator family protein [Bacillota bacterium]|nr:septum formation initiator family protein [Bacillota bacterium]
MQTNKKSVTRLNSSYMKQYDAHVVRQQKKKQRLVRRLMLVAFISVIVISSMAVYHVKQRSLQADVKEKYSQLEDELVTLKKTEANFKEEISLLNDEEYVLDIARTNYFFSKEGELIFKVEDEQPRY